MALSANQIEAVENLANQRASFKHQCENFSLKSALSCALDFVSRKLAWSLTLIGNFLKIRIYSVTGFQQGSHIKIKLNDLIKVRELTFTKISDDAVNAKQTQNHY